MAQKRRFLDVWIIESNTVYREVPFEVVADWVQQGRLLEDDRLRPSGTAEWFRVGASPEFSPYLPRPEPMRADDQAEALEPVELEFRYKKPREEEDDDVDMIPLIDISLVLLIFFMMTTAASVGAVFIPTPEAARGSIANEPDEIVLGVVPGSKDNDVPPVYLLIPRSEASGEPGKPPEKAKEYKTQDELLVALEKLLENSSKRVPVSINADPNIKSRYVRDLTAALETNAVFRARIERKYIGVSEKQ
jgi:biopolymer transport protein ExbD